MERRPLQRRLGAWLIGCCQSPIPSQNLRVASVRHFVRRPVYSTASTTSRQPTARTSAQSSRPPSVRVTSNHGYRSGMVRRLPSLEPVPPDSRLPMHSTRWGTPSPYSRRTKPAGGLLRYGIPNFKLNKAVIDRRLHLLKQEGIEFRYGIEASPVSLQKETFDAIVIATGTPVAREPQYPRT